MTRRDIGSTVVQDPVDQGSVTRYRYPPAGIINSRALLTAAQAVPSSSFDEIAMTIIYPQLRAIHDIKQDGSGSNPEAPEGRDPRRWMDIFHSEITKLGWGETGKDVSPDFTPVPPGQTAVEFVSKRFDQVIAGRMAFGLRLIGALSQLDLAAAGIFAGAALDGGDGGKRLVRCRMVADLTPGSQGRELSLAFLALKYPKEPGPSLYAPFGDGVTHLLSTYSYRLVESRFEELKKTLAQRLADKMKLIVRPFTP